MDTILTAWCGELHRRQTPERRPTAPTQENNYHTVGDSANQEMCHCRLSTLQEPHPAAGV